MPLPNRLEAFLIQKIYQPLFSPFVGRSCRFYPSCSNYGLDSLGKYGFFKANLKIVSRILRCNPFCKGGYDPA
ncbi:MAG: membrane protein insertion efficiency factor YidD [Candidatus Cloacimonetes bacterium]|nr:membrane protein insertion efficiency factor YidD [Candidatus Cloacimonadota bacterium]